ncbi:XdhC family protein [Sphingomonas carotinifaciens]|uniref:Xanthine dehydrogenase accessory factor n=1 Tax=Sphingomonas carotinifaciens TaxID=1166323 RepID=A0A1G7G1F3_9SPHN|nr:XdhC family protein [Sphingomonas carotinifaciens]MBB4086335.1 xanthine dehydrogenase accessory factor [Sphingomonas carotinifaciens]MWC42655.1 XshC-Cox1-family protein [Sphingomonas carotinifaciens]SDE81961.1 xanthine dehydrogenase accessory factor [Sphingomonas carotinifaciens]
MAENDSVLSAARAWKGEKLAIATVVSTWGSAPRPRGSHMLVHADGRFEGSVSGGCVESDILQTAAEVIGGAPFQVKRYGVADAAAWEVGLPCGGEIAVMVQPVSAEGFDPELFDRIAEAREDGRSLTVTTDLATGHSDLRPVETGEIFANRYDPPRRLLIVGAVQIAQSLAALAATLGIATVVIDPRGRFLTEERFPGVTLDDRWPDEAIAAWRPGPATAVVTLSHDIKIDDPALIAALASDAAYVGALGSRRSHAARRERLAAAGLSAAAIDRIDGPVGIDIGAIGPSEIALSIAAAMVGAFHDRR